MAHAVTPFSITTSSVLTQVGEIEKHLTTTETNLPQARQEAIKVCQLGSQWIIQISQGALFLPGSSQFNQDCDAFPIVNKLVELLSLKQFTQQKDIQQPLAKACRIFAESLALQSKCTYETVGAIPQDKKAEYLTLFVEKRRPFPPENVVLHHELKCAHAAAHTLKSDQNLARKYISLTKDIISAAEDQSYCGVVQGIITLFQEVIKEVPQKWLHDVAALSWKTHAFMENKDKTLPQAIEIIKEHTQKYQDIKEVAFDSLETLAQMLKYFLEKKEENYAIFLKGSSEQPGILTLIDIEKKGWEKPEQKMAKIESWIRKNKIDKYLEKIAGIKNLTGKIDPFWKVRYRAIQHLTDVYPQLSPSDQKEVQQRVAHRLSQEKVGPVIQSLKQFDEARKNELDWKEAKKPSIRQVNQNKKTLTEEVNANREKVLQFKGTQKTTESNAEEVSEKTPLSAEQQLLMLELALKQEQLTIEQSKLLSFIPKS